MGKSFGNFITREEAFGKVVDMLLEERMKSISCGACCFW